MLWKKFLEERDVSVRILKEWEKQDDAFYTPGVLVRVERGRGVLREVYGEAGNAACWSVLMGDMPLVQFQGDEYYCPTCEKIIRSGYGLSQEFHMEMPGLNRSSREMPLRQAVEGIFPLLGLLRSGYYVVLDTRLHPTDGNGSFFWDKLSSSAAVGSCLYYHGDGEWGRLRPYFTIATEPREKCRKERVEYYRRHGDCRAVAYYLDGYLTALLDGHHKTFAAALENRDVNALVIVPGHMFYSGMTDRPGYEPMYRMGDMAFSCKDMGLDVRDAKQLKNQLTGINLMDRIDSAAMQSVRERFQEGGCLAPLPYDTEGLAGNYPTAGAQADIERAGGLDDVRLDTLLKQRPVCGDTEIQLLMKALGAMKHPRTLEAADFFLEGRHTPDTYRQIFAAVMKMPRTEVLEQYLIDRMVELEDECPAVGKMILDYL